MNLLKKIGLVALAGLGLTAAGCNYVGYEYVGYKGGKIVSDQREPGSNGYCAIYTDLKNKVRSGDLDSCKAFTIVTTDKDSTEKKVEDRFLYEGNQSQAQK